jgi:hypothetical protein
MITYTKHLVDGEVVRLSGPNAHSIAEGHRFHDTMMQEVADGLAEIVEVDDTPVETFEDRMAASDKIMSRDVETLIDIAIADGKYIPQEMLNRHTAKKAIRNAG